MNTRTILLIALMVGLAGTNVFLLRQLEIERDRAQTEASLRRNDQARIEELEGVRARLELELHGLHAQLMALSQQSQTPEPAPGSAARPATASGRAAAAPQTDVFRMPAFTAAGSAVVEDPELRDSLKVHQKRLLREMYADLIEELGLSSDQADAFLDLLVEQQTGGFMRFGQAGDDPAAVADAMRRAMAETRARLTDLLGPLGMQQYDAYQRTLGERMQANHIARELAALDMPLRDDQRQQLVSALIEERERVAPPPLEPGLPPAELMQRQLQWQEDYDRRVRERLAQVLTPEQLDHISQMQRLQHQMRRMSINAMKEGGPGALRGFFPFSGTGMVIAVDPQGVPATRPQASR